MNNLTCIIPAVSVVEVNDSVKFSDGSILYSYHKQNCCEQHYLGLDDISLADFEGLLFDLTRDTFFERIEGYGIALLPINGHPVRIPGYGYNNGYYSSDLTLRLMQQGTTTRQFDITDCQVIND